MCQWILRAKVCQCLVFLLCEEGFVSSILRGIHPCAHSSGCSHTSCQVLGTCTVACSQFKALTRQSRRRQRLLVQIGHDRVDLIRSDRDVTLNFRQVLLRLNVLTLIFMSGKRSATCSSTIRLPGLGISARSKVRRYEDSGGGLGSIDCIKPAAHAMSFSDGWLWQVATNWNHGWSAHRNSFTLTSFREKERSWQPSTS